MLYIKHLEKTGSQRLSLQIFLEHLLKAHVETLENAGTIHGHLETQTTSYCWSWTPRSHWETAVTRILFWTNPTRRNRDLFENRFLSAWRPKHPNCVDVFVRNNGKKFHTLYPTRKSLSYWLPNTHQFKDKIIDHLCFKSPKSSHLKSEQLRIIPESKKGICGDSFKPPLRSFLSSAGTCRYILPS